MSESTPAARSIDPALLARLVCPQTHGPLRPDEEASELVCDARGVAYPVRDGIPILLTEEALPPRGVARRHDSA